MITLVITALIVIAMIYLLALTKLKTHDIMFLILGVIFIGITISTSPIYGYQDKVLEQEIELEAYPDGICVVRYSNDVYLYKHEIPNDSTEEKSYEGAILREKAVETESKTCKRPVLRKYIKKPKTGVFSFCWREEVEYEFYVPEGTIDYSKEVLN